jgi:DDE family transposase
MNWSTASMRSMRIRDVRPNRWSSTAAMSRTPISRRRRSVVWDLIAPVAESNPAASLKKRGISPDFYPDKFRYDEQTDTFFCPAEKTLTFQRSSRHEGRIEHQYRAKAVDCEICPFRDQCCPKSSPRMIIRKENSEAVKAFRAKMQTEPAKQIYRTRAEVAETPNAWIKAKFGLRQFRLRGLQKVGMEAGWACLTYNIQQWIRLIWETTTECGIRCCAWSVARCARK